MIDPMNSEESLQLPAGMALKQTACRGRGGIWRGATDPFSYRRHDDRRLCGLRIETETVKHRGSRRWDEQSKVFKSAEKALSSEEFQKIMKQFEQEKQKIQKFLR